MSEKFLDFVRRVNEMFPEISDALLAIWEEIDTGINDPAPTCRDKFLANTHCKTKVKGGGKYCSKHKK